MAKIKAILNTQYKSKNGFQIVIKLTHQGDRALHETGYYLPDGMFDSEGNHKCWDRHEGQVKGKVENKDETNRKIREMIRYAQEYFDTCEREGLPIVIKNAFRERVKAVSFSAVAQIIAKRKFDEGKLSAHETILTTLNSLEEFCKGEAFFNDFIGGQAVYNFNTFLIKKGNKAGSRRNKMAYCAHIWKLAIKECGAPKENPFKDIEIKADKAAKRHLKKEEIGKLIKLQFKSRKHTVVRDMFLFSFYGFGMRLHNVVRIKKSDIVDGRVNWKAAKSNIEASAEVNALMQDVINRHINEPGEYLFPFLNKPKVKHMSAEEIYQYSKSINICVNRLLTTIARQAGINKFTFHSARHSFATYAAGGGIPVIYLRDMLTHSSVAMTERYIAGLDRTTIDSYGRQLYANAV